jgi:hypothetical protein
VNPDVSEPATIASRTLLAVDPGGREFALTIAVGRPYEISADEWACPVRVDGLHERLRDQHGADAWQALKLALQLMARLLGYFIQDGGKLFWSEDHREPVALEELFVTLAFE